MALAADFYADLGVVAALAAYDFGQFFKIVRSALGLTQEEFGLHVGLTQSRVCKVENGALRLHDIEGVARLASALGIPADLLGFGAGAATLEGNHDDQEVSWLQRRDFVSAVTAMTFGVGMEGSLHDRFNALVPEAAVDPLPQVGLADVERIEATTAAFREWDNRWGGGLTRPAVIGQLQWVIATSKSAVAASDAVRRRLLVAAADLAGVGGWINFDVERHEEARRLWMIALDAAREAGDSNLMGNMLCELAHQALHLKRPDEALRLLRLAYATTADSDHGTSELALSRIAAHEAWGHAVAGNLQLCKRALGKAEEHFDSSRGDDAPPWLAHFSEAGLHGTHGYALHVLADRVPGVAVEAEPLLRRAIADRGPEYARVKTLNLITLALTYFQRGDGIEEGVRVGYQALDGVNTLNSPRSLSRLQVLDRVSGPYASEPEVAQFREQLRLVLTDTPLN